MDADDPKRLVEAGYDTIAARYAEWQKEVRGSPRERFLSELLRLVPPQPQILELGVGAGIRSTRVLAERGRLTGVDISAEQLRRAQERVPSATFLRADIAEVRFAPGSFDAVVALYVLTHLPLSDLRPLFARIGEWLRPGGLFLATLGAGGTQEGVQADWLGVPMFFSSLDGDETTQLIHDAGLDILIREIVGQREDEGQDEVRFLWVLARRRAG